MNKIICWDFLAPVLLVRSQARVGEGKAGGGGGRRVWGWGDQGALLPSEHLPVRSQRTERCPGAGAMPLQRLCYLAKPPARPPCPCQRG